MNKLIAIFLCLFSPLAFSVSLEEVFEYHYGAWSLPEDAGMKRWVVIHNLSTAKDEGVFHIEVLGRNNNDEAWQVRRLAKHMAITLQAFTGDLVAPTKGKVHPDPFNGAYTAWLNSADKPVCSTSILQCAK